MKDLFTLNEVADILSVSKETLRRWDNNGKLIAKRHPVNNYRIYEKKQLKAFETVGFLFNKKASNQCTPNKKYTVIELFAGAGGLALGMEEAGLSCAMVNEIDKWACKTLRTNRPNWNVIEGDIRKLNDIGHFNQFSGKIDVVTGGFPCQAFSYAGKRLGFKDARGTLFFEFARAVKTVKPIICIGENVRGLLQHDGGKTINGMMSILDEIGYKVYPPKLLKAIFYKVPQKRERTLLIAVRKDVSINYEFPEPHNKVYLLKDALKKGELFPKDVPFSKGQQYPKQKAMVLAKVPPGGYWRDLPLNLQKKYMMKSFYLGGGKTGMARRMSWQEPCLTLTCSPAQKQTERCHPDQTRPFTVREYARIQTFPDNWDFSGSISQQYKQIGNAVPVNLAKEIGYSVVNFLNIYYGQKNS